MNAEQGWLYTDAKYWSTNEGKTAMYYLGLGNNSVTGGRFLAPNAEENEGTYYFQLDHKSFAEIEDAYNYLVEKGYVVPSFNADGDLQSVALKTLNFKYNNGKDVYSTSLVLDLGTYAGKGKAEDELMETIVAYFITGNEEILTSNELDYVARKYRGTEVLANASRTVANYLVFNDSEYEGAPSTFDTADVYSGNGLVITVESYKGEYELAIADGQTSPFINGVSKYTTVATESDLAANTTVLSADLEKGVTYAFANNYTFTKNEPIFLIQDMNDGTAYEAYDENYKYAIDGVDTSYDAVELVLGDGGANTNASVVVKPEDGNLYIKDGVAFKLVKEDADLENGKTYMYNNVEFTLGTTAFALPLLDAEYDVVTYNEFTNEANTNNNYVANGYTITKTKSAATHFYFEDDVDARAYDIDSRVYETEKVETNSLEAGSYNAISQLGKTGKIVVVDVTNYDEEEGTGAYRLATLDPSFIYRYGTQGYYVFSYETLSFNFVPAVYESTTANGTYTNGVLGNASLIATATGTLNGDKETAFDVELFDTHAHTFGMYYMETPENDSDYYVLYTGATTELNLAISINQTKEEAYIETADGETITTKAVELEDGWYAAFETEEELRDAVYAITGLDTALEGDKDTVKTSFYAWYNAAKADLEAGLNALPEGETLPVVASQPTHGATACDYTVSSSSDKVTVAQVNDIDTNVAGVYDLEFSATYEGEVLDTTSIKVVVAPNYTRTWENGRVKTLTSYYVSNPTAKYAEYNYNWAAGTATVTYYTVDGAVADTATITL